MLLLLLSLVGSDTQRLDLGASKVEIPDAQSIDVKGESAPPVYECAMNKVCQNRISQIALAGPALKLLRTQNVAELLHDPLHYTY